MKHITIKTFEERLTRLPAEQQPSELISKLQSFAYKLDAQKKHLLQNLPSTREIEQQINDCMRENAIHNKPLPVNELASLINQLQVTEKQAEWLNSTTFFQSYAEYCFQRVKDLERFIETVNDTIFSINIPPGQADYPGSHKEMLEEKRRFEMLNPLQSLDPYESWNFPNALQDDWDDMIAFLNLIPDQIVADRSAARLKEMTDYEGSAEGKRDTARQSQIDSGGMVPL